MVIAPLTEDTEETVSYGTLQAVAGAIEATITPESADPDVQYADDVEFDTLYPDPEISFSTSMADIPLTIQEMIFGNQIDDNGVLVRTATDKPPYFAVGFMSEKANHKFRFIWLYKVRAKPMTETYKTKEGQTITYLSYFSRGIPWPAGDLRLSVGDFVSDDTSLTQEGSVQVDQSVFFCFGGGGAGRAMCSILAYNGARKIYITDAFESCAQSLAEDINQNFAPIAEFVPYGDFSKLAACNVVLNASGVGMGKTAAGSPLPKEYLQPSQFCFDACYNPDKTRFLLDAEEKGCQVLNGLGMSLYQGVAQVELWSGKNGAGGGHASGTAAHSGGAVGMNRRKEFDLQGGIVYENHQMAGPAL